MSASLERLDSVFERENCATLQNLKVLNVRKLHPTPGWRNWQTRQT
jgi:hypothetical protein